MRNVPFTFLGRGVGLLKQKDLVLDYLVVQQLINHKKCELRFENKGLPIYNWIPTTGVNPCDFDAGHKR